jgi:hypothetical protein
MKADSLALAEFMNVGKGDMLLVSWEEPTLEQWGPDMEAVVRKLLHSTLRGWAEAGPICAGSYRAQ